MQPPHMTTPPQKSKGLKYVALAGALWMLLMVMFLAIWQFLAPTEKKVHVAYTDFLNEVHAGRVSEIRVQGRDIDYRVVAATGGSLQQPSSVVRHTTGPVPDQAFLDTLKPTDPSSPPPKIFFEK